MKEVSPSCFWLEKMITKCEQKNSFKGEMREEKLNSVLDLLSLRYLWDTQVEIQSTDLKNRSFSKPEACIYLFVFLLFISLSLIYLLNLRTEIQLAYMGLVVLVARLWNTLCSLVNGRLFHSPQCHFSPHTSFLTLPINPFNPLQQRKGPEVGCPSPVAVLPAVIVKVFI